MKKPIKYTSMKKNIKCNDCENTDGNETDDLEIDTDSD